MRTRGCIVSLLLATSCGRGPFLGFGDDEGICDEDPAGCTSTTTLQRAADILFIIDNSGSMGDEQGTLARNFGAFIDVLEGEDVGASYRIAVTTTDLDGQLRATSCRSRAGEFRFVWDPLGTGAIELDERFDGCFDVCEHASIDLLPTETTADPQPRERPWLEKVGGQSNLPAGIGMADAFECIGPQGISGNGFERPLESMARVLEHTGAETGFLRDEALLAVIFLTDEADCSMSQATQDLIQSGAEKALWSDPEFFRSTSAVCWNAGVQCDGGPGVYDRCDSADIDLDGQPTTPELAVLHPVADYVDALAAVSRDKQQRGGNGQVLVALIAGVPPDYPDGGELVYRDSNDPLFNREYGIGPGCNFGTETFDSPPGIPPVRLREFADAFATEGRNIFSICSQDYSIALQQIATAIGRLSSRACVPGCVADTNPHVSGLQPRCTLVQEVPADGGATERSTVVPCLVSSEGWSLPEDVDLCYRTLFDRDTTTSSPIDDLSPQCITRGSNLEFVVERREGVPVVPGTSVAVDCEGTDPNSPECQ